jgi:hypothetical protein
MLPLKAKAVLRAIFGLRHHQKPRHRCLGIRSRDATLRPSQTASGTSRTGDLIGRHRLAMTTRWRCCPSASSANVMLQPRHSSGFSSLQMNSLRNQSSELIRDIPPYQTGTGKWRENDPLAAMKHLARARVSETLAFRGAPAVWLCSAKRNSTIIYCPSGSIWPSTIKACARSRAAGYCSEADAAGVTRSERQASRQLHHCDHMADSKFRPLY